MAGAAKYQPYPAYKPSGVEWLGDIPEGWLSIQIGRLYRRTKRTGYSEKELLSVYRDHGVIPKSSRDDNNNKPSEDLAPYQLVKENDLVLNKMKTWQGSIAVSDYEGIVSPAYFVYQPEDKLFEVAHPKYVHFLVRNPMYIAQYLRRSKGIRVSQWDLDPGEFQRIELLLPPLPEQTKIAAFLDFETGKIDALIAKQERLIALLEEKRQAVISHAVTKGLDPTAPLRPSGIDWLGDVPAHWEVKRLKFVLNLRSGGTPSKQNPAFWDGDVPWASSKDLKTETLYDTQDHITQQALDSHAAELVPVGSTLIVVRGMILAHTFPVTKAAVPMAINQDLKALTPSEDVNSDYLALLLRGVSREILGLMDEAGHGTKVLRIEKWTSMELPISPPNEQIKIIKYLQSELPKYATLSKDAQSAITLLKERRTALISAAVTGKIDLRGWQAPSDASDSIQGNEVLA